MSDDEVRALYRAAHITEHEHAEAMALLNRLSPNPPQWARDAVKAAYEAKEAARLAENRAQMAYWRSQGLGRYSGRRIAEA